MYHNNEMHPETLCKQTKHTNARQFDISEIEESSPTK